MKIYDCFPFFNELDVLEIRLQELWDTVDVFVIAESNLSHSGKPKEYIFENNKERYAQWMSKIRHIKVDDMPETQDSWVREKWQRKCLERGLHDAQPEDIVIVADCDEIPRAEIIEMIKEDENLYDRYVLYIPQFQYKLNYMKWHDVAKNANIAVTRFHVFTDPQLEREVTFFWNRKPENTVMVDHGGWHFTYLGDNNHAITKIQNFAHTETDTPEMIRNHNIDFFIQNKYGHHGINNNERFEWVVVDDYFPKCIIDNLDKWNDRIIPNASLRVTDLYK
jgi:beta-1,4-mannosyl-glycoprotein beta-1,4-N-acetylglucosaminyltransferase